MARMSGWQKAGLIAGVGCFSIVAILVIGVAVAVVWARSTLSGMGDTTPTRTERTITLPMGAAAADVSAAGNAEGSPVRRLTVELQEGNFTVQPGAPGTSVQVEGRWAPALFELTENHDDAGGGQSTIRFRSKGPAWARFFAGLSGQGGQPQVTVRIPPDAPLNLALRVSMGESRIDLGGLTLDELDLDLTMGEHRVRFDQPVAEDVRRVRVNARMGNVRLENLGNARAATVDATGSMGNLTADLGGAWPADKPSEVSFEQSMGELVVRVPSAVRLENSFSGTAPEGDVRSGGGSAGPDAPVLRLRVSTSMGGSRVVRY